MMTDLLLQYQQLHPMLLLLQLAMQMTQVSPITTTLLLLVLLPPTLAPLLLTNLLVTTHHLPHELR
jgi:hypothetical protein